MLTPVFGFHAKTMPGFRLLTVPAVAFFKGGIYGSGLFRVMLSSRFTINRLKLQTREFDRCREAGIWKRLS